jgi:hypothetical protein
MRREEMLSFGVFKPVGHVVISLRGEQQAKEAATAIERIGVADADVHYMTDTEMLDGAEADIQRAGLGAEIGQDLNLVRAHRELAAQGYHWLIVKAENRDQAIAIAEAAEPHEASRAQYYGRLIVEELISPDVDAGQRNESPETGLDSETPSGTESQRVQSDESAGSGATRRH